MFQWNFSTGLSVVFFLYQLAFQIGIFHPELGENILFGIGNWAEFRPQIRVIESPVGGGEMGFMFCDL